VYVEELGIVIKQLPIPPGGAEQPAARHALESLDIEDVLITGDAIHTCEKTANLIVKKKLGTCSLSKIIIPPS
jgi:hypothetical protein